MSAALVCAALAAALLVTRPRSPATTPLQARIVRLVEREVGYRTDPATSYCNRFSAFWHSGAADCGNTNLDEQWCADFAAWAWREAGVRFTYDAHAGDINSASVSFYHWGVAHGTWHAVGTGYVPEPGDVAIYGLDLSTDSAQHVAVVTSYVPGTRGPNVVNGDGSRTGFSVVERGRDQYKADLHDNGGRLAGYVAPIRPGKRP